jgi:Tfp pilus assembly protein PilF
VAYGQFDKAIAIGKLAVENSKNDSLVGTLAKIQLGSTFAIKGDCGEATKVWGDVLANKTMSAMHAEVSLKSGLCFEKVGEVAKATDMYQRAVTTAGPESATASTARGLLRALELKAQK